MWPAEEDSDLSLRSIAEWTGEGLACIRNTNTSTSSLTDEDSCDKPKVKPFAKNFTIFNNDDKVHHGQVKM